MSSDVKPRENLRDGFLITAALVALAVEVVFLLHQTRLIELPFARRPDPRGVTIGEVTEKKATLRRRAEGSLSWFSLNPEDRIYLNDTLATGPQAWARLKFPGESLLDLEADTLVRFTLRRALATPDNVLKLDIGQGIVRVMSVEKPLRVQLRSHEIALTASSEIVLTQPTLTQRAQVHVKRGEVKLTPIRETASQEDPAFAEESAAPSASPAVPPGAEPLVLKPGEALQFDRRNSATRVETNLNVEPRYPLPEARIVAKNAIEKISIYWAGDEGELLEVSQEEEFAEARRFLTSGKSAQVELAPGKYFWRVRRDVAMSRAREFTLLPPVRYRLTNPVDGFAFKEGMPLSLVWEEVEGAEGYRLEVSTTKDFAEIFLRKELSTTKHALPSLAPGIYFWRVRASHAKLGEWPASVTHSFIVERVRKRNRDSLRTPSPGRALPSGGW